MKVSPDIQLLADQTGVEWGGLHHTRKDAIKALAPQYKPAKRLNTFVPNIRGEGIGGSRTIRGYKAEFVWAVDTATIPQKKTVVYPAK